MHSAGVVLDREVDVSRGDWLLALVLAFGIWPVVAVGVVGSYGFMVWMYQIIAGPPGPPA